jgi:hypothetical protein
MIDVSKALRMNWNPITKPGGHPLEVIGNSQFRSNVDSFARGKEELKSAKPRLDSLFPNLDQNEVYSIFCNSVRVAREDLLLCD